MSNIIQERYNPVVFSTNATYTSSSGSPSGIGGFLCVSSGTITITRSDGKVIVNAFPMTGGVYYPMPFYIGNEFTVTLAGGASGTLGTS